MLRAIAVVYALALLIHLPRLLETRVEHVQAASLIDPGTIHNSQLILYYTHD